MRVTVFTSNQPRHVALLECFAAQGWGVYAVQECTTVFPGEVADFYRRSDVMQRYFAKVLDAEKSIFGNVGFAPSGVLTMAIKDGDLSRLPLESLQPALESDAYVVFGSSYIRGGLLDFLVQRRAINIHMGVAPQYRGSSCNFWALYDGRPEMVGATIHYLAKKLDAGAILFHALPRPTRADPYELGMLAVEAAHEGLTRTLADGAIWDMLPTRQQATSPSRYTRAADFTDEVAGEYLERRLTPGAVFLRLCNRNLSEFVRPYVA